MERWQGRVALVTGASVGIGAAIVRALVGNGVKVIACSRNIENIEKQAKELKGKSGVLIPFVCDVSKDEDVLSLFKKIREDPNLGHVDICINNAGLSHSAPLLSGEPSQWRHMFEVNVIGLLMVTQQSFKLMKEKNIDDGQIILINSMSGIRPVNNKNIHCYMASKYAVNAIREGIRNELREIKSHIRISQVCPGLVETEFAERSTSKEAADKTYSGLKCLQPEDIAAAVVHILSAPPHVEINDIMVRPTEQIY